MVFMPLVGMPPALKLVPGSVGAPFGNFTQGVGVAGVFAGQGSASTTGWPGVGRIGKIWPSRQVVGRVRATSGLIDWDGASQGADITLRVKGSNDTTDGINGTWTTLYTTTFADPPYDGGITPDTRDMLSGLDASTAYLAHVLEVTGTYPWGGQDYGVSGIEFYAYSWI
jgi:hypothetical protein